jgi:hypothetical protein
MDEAQKEMIVMPGSSRVSSVYLCGCNRRNGGDVL